MYYRLTYRSLVCLPLAAACMVLGYAAGDSTGLRRKVADVTTMIYLSASGQGAG